MSRIKPLTAINCRVEFGDAHTMTGGSIYACTRCRGIGFFDMRGTIVRGGGTFWIDQRTARKIYENKAGTIRTPSFNHKCMRDTKHPMDKKVSQKKPKHRPFNISRTRVK